MTERDIFKHYIRLHNMPQNSSLCQILHFLWEVVDFKTEEALICAYSANNIIVGFTRKEYAEEAVLYCNGRNLYGRIVSVHSANDEDLQRVIDESNKAGPGEGPPRLKRRRIYHNDDGEQGNKKKEACFVGINSDDESDPEDMLLAIPDFFKKGAPPDTIDFRRSSSQNRCADENNSQEIEVLKRKGEKEDKTGSGSASNKIIRKVQTNDTETIFYRSPLNPSSTVAPPIKKQKPLPPPKFATGANAMPRGPFPLTIPLPPSVRPPAFISNFQPPSFSPLSNIPLPPDNNYTKLDIQLTISSRHCLLKWMPENHCIDNQDLEIIGSDSQIVRKRLGRSKQYLLASKEGARYKATIKGFDQNGKQMALGFSQFRATFSITEMDKLFVIANRFCSGEMYQFSILHRCKPRAYFDDIYNQPDGLRLMKPYLKDENGHRGSPINSEMCGFFFSALLITDELPDRSPFGDVQMIMDAEKMLDFGRTNMYFADFYCNEAIPGQQGNSSSLHYITVVICAKESETDKFCASRLKKLDPWNNKFMKIHKNQGKILYLMAARRDLLVEVYYTEAISLFDAKEFKKITPMGRGSSKPTGLPNNQECKTCNFTD